MKDASLLEKILGKFLSREQIVALVEEISKGVSVVNGIIDKNEKIKAQKEFVFETFRSIDRMIAQSNKIPATFKLFYDTAKVKIHDLLEPIITGMVMENDFSDLDDIPDVKKNDVVQKRENTARPQESSQQQANGGEQQSGRRRRNRRHGRNRNNNQNQEQQKPVETSPETSQAKPMPKPVQTSPETSQAKPMPKPVQTSHETSLPTESKPEPAIQKPKPVQKQEPKPVQTFHETSLPTESKPEPAKKPAGRGRTQKKPAEKPESVQKPEPKPVETFQTSLPTESKPEPAKKPARRGRTPKKPKETNE